MAVKKATRTPKAIADALAPVMGEIREEIDQPKQPTKAQIEWEQWRIKMAGYIKAVRDHAMEHYNDEGMAWDEVVEALDDQEIEDMVYRCRSEQGAINKMEGWAAARGSHRQEIVNA